MKKKNNKLNQKQTTKPNRNETKQENGVSKTCPGNSVQLELQKGLLESPFFRRYWKIVHIGLLNKWVIRLRAPEQFIFPNQMSYIGNKKWISFATKVEILYFYMTLKILIYSFYTEKCILSIMTNPPPTEGSISRRILNFSWLIIICEFLSGHQFFSCVIANILNVKCLFEILWI